MSKKFISLFLVMLMLLGMTAAAEDAAITITDMYGRVITLDGPATRIIALEPSDCEILCALGCEEALIGRGRYCDYPASVLELPVVESGEKANVEEILALNPQIVLMSDMAIDEELVYQLEDSGVKTVVCKANNIESLYTAIRMIGTLMGKGEAAEGIVADMQAAFSDISAKCEQSDKTVYFEVMPLEWGLWSAGSGTFMHELAEICGIKNAFADIEGWQAISEEQVIARNPDYIVLVTGMGETAADEVMNRVGWEDITAIKEGRVYNADSYALTRPAPRLKDAAIDLYHFLYGVEHAGEAAQ